MYRCIDIMYVMYWYYLFILYVTDYSLANVASKDWFERLPTAPKPIDKNQKLVTILNDIMNIMNYNIHRKDCDICDLSKDHISDVINFYTFCEPVKSMW